MASSGNNPPRGLLPPGFWARWGDYTGISGPFLSAARFLVGDVWASLRRGHLGVLFGRSSREVREHAFESFYQAVGHNFANYESTTPVPGLVASAYGVVLDLGPGTGNQLGRFDASRIEHVYGVEPNTAFTGAFAQRLRGTGLGQDAKYTLIPCGIEEGETLARFGVREGSVDCVVSMQVLCSLPDLEDQVRHMYTLLKPGGQLIFWEHCRNPDPLTRIMQWLWCLLWPVAIGGCRLDRVTKEALIRAANWETVEIETDMEPHMMMPRLWGRLVKPRAA